MMEDGDGTIFPVVFFDGEHEINIGCVSVHPSLEFKKFISCLSQMIGISPNQITVYLVDRSKPKSAAEARRKFPVTGKVNFAAIAKATDCFFLAVLKRSRRNRKRKPRHGGAEFADYLSVNRFPSSPEKLLLLRRKQADLENPQVTGYISPHYNQVSPAVFVDYNEGLQRFQVQQENRAISTVDLHLDSNLFPPIEQISPRNRAICEECADARRKGISAPFHWCVFDAVTVGFRSPAGPIARPLKVGP
ncbi:hypothetical protein NMG60_11008583 [Bertholletia excelsa]